MTQEIQTTTTPVSGALTIGDVRAQVQLIHQVMSDVMKKDEHYGIIPGTDKPTLYKAGAEKLCLTFRLDPQYEVDQVSDGDHLTVFSKCTIYHSPSGNRLGSGCGSCSTKESKYAYRKAYKKCPKCSNESIFKSKDGTGWYCWTKKGGCGAQFPNGDKTIESQKEGRVPNEDIADQYNTVLKMANKRSLVAAVLNVTAASDIFTQDLDDTPLPDQPTTGTAPNATVTNPKPEPAKVHTPEVLKPETTVKDSTTPGPEERAIISMNEARTPNGLIKVNQMLTPEQRTKAVQDHFNKRLTELKLLKAIQTNLNAEKSLMTQRHE